jgi:hypothetical protein
MRGKAYAESAFGRAVRAESYMPRPWGIAIYDGFTKRLLERHYPIYSTKEEAERDIPEKLKWYVSRCRGCSLVIEQRRQKTLAARLKAKRRLLKRKVKD